MSEQTWIEGSLSRVLWASEETGYAVVRLATPAGEITTVGSLFQLRDQPEGTFVACEGRWESHAVHGRQFRVTGMLQGTPRTLEGMKRYLSSSAVKRVGPALAARIVDHFGMATLSVLSESPQRLTEVSGVGKRIADAITDAWGRDDSDRALEVLLHGLGMTGRLIHQVKRKYGDKAADVVTQNPYQLAEDIYGVGFKTADAIAKQSGLPEDAPGRVRAAVLHVLRQNSKDGHCYLGEERIRRAVRDLSVPTEGLIDALDGLTGDARIIGEDLDERGFVYFLWSTHRAERFVAQQLGLRIEDPLLPLGHIDEEITKASQYVGVTLDEVQHEAVRCAVENPVAVVTGGPGTGKTTLVKVALRVWRDRGLEVSLASPTGRAARRLSESTGADASTLHRLLQYNPSEGRFTKTMTEPLETDVLVIDEMSMVDLTLMGAVMSALPTNKQHHLLLVGDSDQLPSVGAGQVLRDIIESKVVPTVRLTQVHRQAADSGIIQSSVAIGRGELPVSGERSGHTDVFLLHRERPEAVLSTLLKVVAERLPKKGFSNNDIQVLTPTRKGLLGTRSLNNALQSALNPNKEGWKIGDRSFRLADRVLCTKNRYDLEVFNGDVGVITQVSTRQLTIDFDGRVVAWERSDLDMLDLAWAMTIHKSQGSEYGAVVLVLHSQHHIMLRRNLFYTAVTRAKRFLCVVGNERSWKRAVNANTVEPRRTALRQRLRGEL